MNRSDSPARTLLFSSVRGLAVSVYPDSDTIGVWPGDETNDLVFERGTAVPWAHGEKDWKRRTDGPQADPQQRRRERVADRHRERVRGVARRRRLPQRRGSPRTMRCTCAFSARP